MYPGRSWAGKAGHYHRTDSEVHMETQNLQIAQRLPHGPCVWPTEEPPSSVCVQAAYRMYGPLTQAFFQLRVEHCVD